MKIEDEYVFNNGIYDIAVRSLKATFFDVLSFCDSLEYNNEQEFCDKLTNLKSKMNDIIDSVRDLDCYKKLDNNNELFIKTDTVQNNSIDVPMIDYGEDSAISKEESVVEEKEKVNDVESSIDVEVDKVDENNNIDSVNKETEVVDTDIVQSPDNSIVSFKKNNDDIVKAILVSDIQYSKLDNSKESQLEILNQVNFFKDNNLKEESIDGKDIDSSENLTEKAVMLYKQGKTKEAQEIMDKINSMNHIN